MNEELKHISTLSILLPVGAGLFYARKLKEELLWILFFFCFATLVEGVAFYLGEVEGWSNKWLLNLYGIVELVFYCWILNRMLHFSRQNLVLLILLSAYSIYWIFSTLVNSDLSHFNTSAITIQNLIVTIYSGLVLIRLSRNHESHLFSNYQFWFASGALLYFSVTVLVFSVYQTVSENNYITYSVIWEAHSVMNIFSNLLFAISFLCKSPKNS